MNARALETGPRFWLAMFTASAFGTNLGDFWVDGLGLARPESFASLVVICGAAIWADGRWGRRSEVGYWIAIVALRAVATNVADFLTHDMALGYLGPLCGLAVLGAGACVWTRPGGAGSPLIDARYWLAMLLAGLFGTVGGDLVAHSVGLYAAAGGLVVVLLAVLGVRARWAPGALPAYWCAVFAERCAATPVGDALASRHALGFGLPWAMVCTGLALALALLWRATTPE